MSIVVLKRKSKRFEAPISGRGKKGFSINGGLRNQGWVGQTNSGRANHGTVFRGAYPMGNGGCCGTYVINIQNSGGGYTNDPDIIKRSTMNTNGLLLTTVKHPTSVFTDCSGSCVNNWVKDLNGLNYSQSMFIRTLKIKNICPNWLHENTTCSTVCHINYDGHPNTDVAADCNKHTNSTHFIGTRKKVTNMTTKKTRQGAISSSDYISGMLQARQCLPTPGCKAPFPIALNHNGCDTNYLTPDDAIRAGALPPDWGACEKVRNCCPSIPA
jgi:hypothetical protein